MATNDLRDRLQPALLDRLTDDNPENTHDADDRRVLNKNQLRQAVLRDLSWLLNAVQPLGKQADEAPYVAESVLNYGLPPMSGQLASKVDVPSVEQSLRDAILRFEPRILEHSLVVKAVDGGAMLDAHNIIEFEIRGFLWAQPIPLELLLRTQLDLEAGQVKVRDGSPSTIDGGRR
ncbi:MAG: type VI secretion system baseplate subunit TssE [Aquabacterium sp.]|uniref:type VI secretion system baseplate subunit TssE n=1 Tax=Aquabacterium sp. TaxID=1872578 RepID=UPI0025BA45B4|nr:type VI secretion system baseplate subunit TssE [Aquabacterium sp.]MBI5926816.1 type VI secretion system baseplate subunit TssE [Aquabacterium sp.]